MFKDGEYSESFFHNTVTTSHKVKAQLHWEKTAYQEIAVYQTESVGKLLTLDGKTMVSERDEFVYHEVMAHIPVMSHPNAKRVLVIGGGDGGVVRELVKHPQLTHIDLVEIDERVVEVSKIFFPDCTSGLSDPRVRVLAQDGIEFIKNVQTPYDIICVDSTDPVEFAQGLFTETFYGQVLRALGPQGIMVAQTENPFYDEFGIGKIYNNLRAHFPVVQSFTAPMIIYPGVFWTFAFASKGPRGHHINANLAPFMTKLERKLKWYNQQWHVGSFALSNLHKDVTGCQS